jgi:density-regulated protein
VLFLSLCLSHQAQEGDEKKKKKRSGPKLKKVVEVETKVVLTKVQRQKRKYVTVVAGLETVPNLKIKDAAKVFGKKFSSGASINEGPTGVKEVLGTFLSLLSLTLSACLCLSPSLSLSLLTSLPSLS